MSVDVLIRYFTAAIQPSKTKGKMTMMTPAAVAETRRITRKDLRPEDVVR